MEELRAGHNLTSILTPFPAHNRGSGILGGDLNITVWSGVRILAVPRAGCVILDRYETSLEPWGQWFVLGLGWEDKVLSDRGFE